MLSAPFTYSEGHLARVLTKHNQQWIWWNMTRHNGTWSSAYLWGMLLMRHCPVQLDLKPAAGCRVFPLRSEAHVHWVGRSSVQIQHEPFPLRWLLTCERAYHARQQDSPLPVRSSPEPSVISCRRRQPGGSSAPAPPGEYIVSHASPSSCRSSEVVEEQSSAPQTEARCVHAVTPALSGMPGPQP